MQRKSSTSNAQGRLTLKRGTFKSVRGEYYGTPKEVWQLRVPRAFGGPRRIAREFLAHNSDLFKLEPRLVGLRVQRVIHSLGAAHVILQQVHRGRRVHRAYVTVHVNRRGKVFLAKNRSVPAPLLPKTFDAVLSRDAAVRKARSRLPKKGRKTLVHDTERLWFPKRDKLVPAWKVRLTRQRPREDWIVYVNARTGAVLSKYDNLSEAPSGRATVFYPNPVIALGDHKPLLTPRRKPLQPPSTAYRAVTLAGLDSSGTLAGKKVTTAPTKARIKRRDFDFQLRSHQPGFEETMVYFHVDAAVRYLEELGYTGSRAIFRAPIRANVNGTRADNSWYSPSDRMLTFGTGDIDDAEDAETILHELGHAIQDAICPDFGQSSQAAAMGEGFGDYFAASFFESVKPAAYKDTVMSWDGLLMGLDMRAKPPSLRRLDGKSTFSNFVEDGDEHDNGPIWSATLWDVRNAVGRAVADKLILESHFQLDGFTTFARGARAILDADRNLDNGRHVAALTRIFKRRHIGPL